MTTLTKLRDALASFIVRSSLRWAVLSLAAAAVIATAAYSYREIDSELTAVALSRREAVAQLMAATLTEKLGRVADVAISLSTRVKFRNLVAQGKWLEAIEFMRSVPQDFPHIERLFLTDTKGTLKADVPALPGVRGVNLASHDWFQGVSRSWQPYVSSVYTRAAAPHLNVVAVAVPVKSSTGHIVGILVLQIRIEKLLERVAGIDMGTDAFVYIVDSRGQMAFDSRHRDREKIIDLSATTVVQKLRRGEQGVEIGFDAMEQEESIIAYAAVPDYGWGVVVQQPTRTSMVLMARDEQLRRLLMGYGIILLFGAMTAILMLRIASARQRAEGDARFVTIVNTATDAIISVDQDQRIVLFNHGAEVIFGYSAAEIIGQPLNRLLPARFGATHHRHMQNFAATSETNRLMGARREILGRRKDGVEFPAEASISKLTERGRTIFTTILRDVSERRKIEDQVARLGRILDDSSNEIYVFSAEDLHFVQVNRGAQRNLGYTLDEIRGLTPFDIKPEHTRESFEAVIAPLRRGEMERLVFETVHRRKDGSDYPVEVQLQLMRDESPPVFVAIIQDITERKRAEEEIRHLNADLERKVIERTAELAAANKELEAFSYSVSHDLRAPLRSIDGFSQALLEDYSAKLDDQARDYLGRVRAASQRMADLIDDMLNLSRVTRMPMQRAPVDLSDLAASIAEELRRAQPERAVEVVIQPGLVAEGDAKLMRILLTNLLANAWKFTGKQEHARIEFGAQRDNGVPAYFVRDNGAGFDMKYADKLFGVFQRLHAMDEFPGTGVGLATVQRVVHRHGGLAWAEGAEGHGATFYFTVSPAPAQTPA